MKRLIVALFCTHSALAATTVTFNDRTVTASGIRPGADILVFAIAKIPRRYDYKITRWIERTSDADRDSVITYIAPEPIPSTSVWLIADLATGDVDIATPNGTPPTAVERSHGRAPADGTAFSFDRDFLDLIYVHAGKGAWTWHANDGGRKDTDGANGITTIEMRSAESLTDDPPPKNLSLGGTLIAIDYIELRVLKLDVTTLLGRGQQ